MGLLAFCHCDDRAEIPTSRTKGVWTYGSQSVAHSAWPVADSNISWQETPGKKRCSSHGGWEVKEEAWESNIAFHVGHVTNAWPLHQASSEGSITSQELRTTLQHMDCWRCSRSKLYCRCQVLQLCCKDFFFKVCLYVGRGTLRVQRRVNWSYR